MVQIKVVFLFIYTYLCQTQFSFCMRSPFYYEEEGGGGGGGGEDDVRNSI
jgi:hypothetical protein